MRTPTFERPHPNAMEAEYLGYPEGEGIQRLYRFSNNYGASVIRTLYSYGYERGLWELALIRFTSDNILDFELIENPEILEEGVEGYLTEEQVDEILGNIEKLNTTD